ncbi:MAG: hypothetical protein C5B43_04665 [Verrucomicrobia bacterium]|nr:MAG: hypothetical protein C5B43_04665 [Verrucomicrobiota bacterium]
MQFVKCIKSFLSPFQSLITLFQDCRRNLKSILLILFCISPLLLHSKEKSLDQCLKKNTFICGDAYSYLLNIGTNIDKDILPLSSLKMYKQRAESKFKAIYFDKYKNVYYVKEANPITEFMGSRLMNLILGRKVSPIVRIINDQKFTVASLELQNFKTQESTDLKHKSIIGQADLDFAMNFIGLVDRHSGNMGYVSLDSNTLLAARVDFDASFDFESSFFRAHSLNTNYLNLKHLFISIEQYSKDETLSALKKIINLPDEKIVMVIFQCWATFVRAGYSLELKHCLAFANQLIERKHAIRDALKDKHSALSQAIEKKTHIKKKTEHIERKPKKKKVRKKR